MRIVSLILFLFMVCFLKAQSSIELAGMTWKYIQEDDFIIMELRAPTKGWIGVGFNDRKDIVGSDLLLFRVKNDRVEVQDMYVKGVGNPVSDSRLGGSTDVEILDYEESVTHTFIRFRRPYLVEDRYDYQLTSGQEFWLILAYSVSDDFGHHSRMRQHQKVIFKTE